MQFVARAPPRGAHSRWQPGIGWQGSRPAPRHVRRSLRMKLLVVIVNHRIADPTIGGLASLARPLPGGLRPPQRRM